jgi:heptosyltransferase-1
MVIDMQGLIKSAVVSRILSKNIHGFDKNSIREPFASLFYKTGTNIAYEENIILRNAKIVSDALDFEITKEMIDKKEKVFPINYDFDIAKDKKNIAFVIGASWDSKKYPKENIVKIINELDVNAYIIWGNEQEKAEAEFIRNHTKNAKLAPKMQLNELVSFISYMDLVVGNDTGPTHIAWVQNVKSITIFGPTNDRMIYKSKNNIFIKSDSDVNINKINKNDFSIRDINYKEVLNSIKGLLDGI